MKQYSVCVLFFLMLLSFSCKKAEGEYDFAIFYQIPPQYRSFFTATLFVADKQGNILEKLDIPSSFTQTIEHTFKVGADNPLEICDIHVIFRVSSGMEFYHVLTHLDVKNGASIALDPPAFIPFFLPGTDQKVLRVLDLESLDSLGFLGLPPLGTAHYEPSEKKGVASSFVAPDQGVIAHIKANGEPGFRYLYLPDSIMSAADWAYDVYWSDFKPVPTATPVKTPAGAPVLSLEADALFPGLSRFVSLGPGINVAPLDPQFLWPIELPRILRLKMVSSEWITEKIFQQGESLEIKMPDIQINNASSTPGKQLQVDVTGDIDLIEAHCTALGRFSWKIHGSPDSFGDVRLPDFSTNSRYRTIVNAFRHFKVCAYQFGKHDYERVREGFPFRSTELFALARSGYTKVWKEY